MHIRTTRGARARTLMAAAAVLLATAGLAATSSPALASVSSDGGFEFADGNLAPQPSVNFDWNSFTPVTWTGSAPYRVASKSLSGWTFGGLEDARETTSDSGFAGGTKQDQDCATVSGAKAPNKDDLQRVYLSTKIVGGDVFLGLAWIRIPQNTTSPSAHIGFEFNKATSGGCTGSGLVKRTAGDMLVVYDFEGGSDDPTISLRRWITSGACEIASNNAPCWGVASNLTSLGYAEAKVNTTTAVSDTLKPGGTDPGIKEFGEAGINLTDAGVFSPSQCQSFGKAYAVSRSSGNSGTAQMKDLVGPGNFTISNCGSITIRKVTENGDDSFAFGTTGGLTPSSFSLSDGQSRTYSNAAQGSYTVTENLTTAQSTTGGWSLKDLQCTATGTGTSAVPDLAGGSVAITLAASGNVDCTYTNKRKLSPTITTKLNGDQPSITVDVGSTVHDTATLAGATANAGGTVTYTVYSDNACTLNARDAGTKAVTNGSVADSNGLAFNSVGTFYWQAVYSGDTNNFGATSTCTDEVLTVAKKNPAATTAQNLLPNDSFSLTGGFNATGNVTFALYAPSDATCSGTPAYTETVALASNAAATSNTTFLASAEGTWRWRVVYAGDDNNNGVTLGCGLEQFTIDNDSTS